MTENIFNLLQASPVLSIVLGFVLALTLIFILKDEIRKWVIKHYELYDKQTIIEKLDETMSEPDIGKLTIQTNRNAVPNYKRVHEKIRNSFMSKL